MNAAIILAGGQGRRMGADIPKQFLEINGKPLVLFALQAFASCPEIDYICLVCLKAYRSHLQELLVRYGLSAKVDRIVSAGETRRESSYNGVMALRDVCAPDDVVLIHDGARPNLTARIIRDNIAAANRFGACETVIPVQDTIIYGTETGKLHTIPDRNQLYQVQTPQSFRYHLICEAHEKVAEEEAHQQEFTDDAGMLLHAGYDVHFVKGDKMNLKVTSPEDLRLMEFYGALPD